jgi:hypothetical protein
VLFQRQITSESKMDCKHLFIKCSHWAGKDAEVREEKREREREREELAILTEPVVQNLGVLVIFFITVTKCLGKST